MSKIQVKLEDGTLSNFTAFAVDNADGSVKEFSNYNLAKAYLQQLQQNQLTEFMTTYYCFISYSKANQTAVIKSFIDWYANLSCFHKTAFIKLLEKVVKVDE
jgi:hypothetical protein